MKSGGSLDIEEGTEAVGAREVQSLSGPTAPLAEAVRGTWIPKRVPTQQKVLLLLLCVAAAILDPLFFYIPSINRGSICLEPDMNLGIIVIVLRSLVDFLYLVSWCFQWRAKRKHGAGLQTPPAEQTQTSPVKIFLLFAKMSCFLPLPQATTIAIIIMKGNPRLKQAVMRIKFSVFIQFILRATVLVPLCHKTMENSPTLFKFRFSVGAGFNLMFFVLASHFVGAFWYLLSVGRTMDCWRSACWSHDGCNPDSLYCGGSVSNKSNLNDYCFLGKTSNVPPFKFGIYFSAIENNIVASTGFSLKFTYCFWWGLRNLSSLGQNLENSDYEWELFFSICISIIGLILVALFIGNMQAYFQFRTQEQLQEMDKKEKKSAKIRKRYSDLLNWETFQWLAPDLKRDIMTCEEDKWLGATEVDLPTALDCLPQEIRWRIIRALCSKMESEVKIFQALKGILTFENRVKPMVYQEGSVLFKKDDPVREMVIVLSGTLNVQVGDTQAQERRAWEFIDEELLGVIITSSRTSPPSSPSPPPSKVEVKATKKVDAFVITAEDLHSLMKDVDLKIMLTNISQNLNREIKLKLCLPILSKLPALEKVHEQALQALCKRAVPVSFRPRSVLVQDGSDINKMFIIITGKLRSYDKKVGSVYKECSDAFLGEELLQQALTTNSSDNSKLPVSTIKIQAEAKVEAFQLMLGDIRWMCRESRKRMTGQ